jgi:hypothetical protein
MVRNVADRVTKHLQCHGGQGSVGDKLRTETIITADGMIQQVSTSIAI